MPKASPVHLKVEPYMDEAGLSAMIKCDPDTAQLIADALEIINPDCTAKGLDARAWARDCSFTIATVVAGWRRKRSSW